jgi:transposase
VIVRDRGASYRKASTKEAPHAQQVLDRWHLLKNLGEVIQKTLAHQIDVLRQAGKPGQEEHPADVLSST